MIDDETLIAYLDGELDPEGMARVEAALSDDRSLAERLERQLRLKTRVTRAFDQILTEPVPASISAADRPQATVLNLAAVRARTQPAPIRRWWVQAGAMAASLAVGLIGGLTLNGARPAAVVVDDGGVFASATLGRGLDTQLAGTPGEVRVQLSFRDAQGRACRTFAWAASEGLACKEQDGWAIEGLFGHKNESHGSDYRMASGQSPALMELTDSLMAGEPFTRAQEQAAHASGWQRSTKP